MLNDSLESGRAMSHFEGHSAAALTKDGSTGGKRNRLFTCIDQVPVVGWTSGSNKKEWDSRVQLFLCWIRSHSKDTVLTL